MPCEANQITFQMLDFSKKQILQQIVELNGYKFLNRFKMPQNVILGIKTNMWKLCLATKQGTE